MCYQIRSWNQELIVILYFQSYVNACKKPLDNNNDIHKCLVLQFHLGGVLLYKFIFWIILNRKVIRITMDIYRKSLLVYSYKQYLLKLQENSTLFLIILERISNWLTQQLLLIVSYQITPCKSYHFKIITPRTNFPV